MSFNPTRRNRNIGTARQGHGRNNSLVIPQPAEHPQSWKEQLGLHRHLVIEVSGKPVDFFVEETTGGCVHACSVEDIAHLLSYLPDSDWAGLSTIVLRQPTRKQRIVAPAWGRLLYFAELGRPDRKPVARGPAILLEAIDPAGRIKWPASLRPDMADELERLRSDGHRIERAGHHQVFLPTREAARATQLYRTLPHEIGHWADWLDKVETPCARGGDYRALSDAYFARAVEEREAFAHRYADSVRRQLELKGVIPFEQIVASDGNSTE